MAAVQLSELPKALANYSTAGSQSPKEGRLLWLWRRRGCPAAETGARPRPIRRWQEARTWS
eukprot:2259869-Pyramimonas_sp.AAC.1